MTCPHCHGRYAFNTCPGKDEHVPALFEPTPDGQPRTYGARLQTTHERKESS